MCDSKVSEINKIDIEVQTSLESLEGSEKEVAIEELRRLREEKEFLENKVKGYLTLSEICHDYKEDLKKLQQEYNKLLEKTNSHSSSIKAKIYFSESPTPVNDPGLDKRTDLEQWTKAYDPNNSSTHFINTENVGQVANDNINTRRNHIRTSELFDTGLDPPKSSEGSKAIPNSRNAASYTQTSNIQDNDKFPMQESMVESNFLDHSSVMNERQQSQSLTGLGFEHVQPENMVLGQSARTSQKNEVGDLMNFSLTKSMTGDSPIEELDKPENFNIDIVLKSVNMDTETTTEGQKVAEEVKRFIDSMSKKLEKSQNMNLVLIKKNNDQLKTIKTLEKDNSRLLKKVQKLEQEKYELSMSRSRSPAETQGWVHVEKLSQGEMQKSNPAPTAADTQKLHDQIKQLKDANQRWSDEWDKLQKHFESRIADLQTERDRLTREITELKVEEDAKQRDYEKMLMVSKKKANEEESAKEEALTQLTSANFRLEAMQAQIAEMAENTSVLQREKRAIETELSVIQQRPIMSGSAGMTAAPTPMTVRTDRSRPELQTDIDVLRQQLLVFQEDFDKERQDRATAQSIMDDFKKQNATLKKKLRHFEQKCSSLETQKRTAEETSRYSGREAAQLQQELTDVKNQLQREREANQRYNIPNYTPSQPPVIQSAGIHPQQQLFGQPIPQPQQYIVPTMPQNRVQIPAQQYHGTAGMNYSPTSGSQQRPPNARIGSQYFQANQTGQETELLPGAWSCNQCTYVNYPGRTVCEICGYIQSPNAGNFKYSGHPNEPLRPRGEENQRPQHHQYQPYNVRSPAQNDITTNAGNHAII